MHDRDEKCIQNFGQKIWREETNWDLGTDGKVMDLREIGQEGVDWLHLAQDSHQLWALVNMEMNLWDPQKAGNFLAS